MKPILRNRIQTTLLSTLFFLSLCIIVFLIVGILQGKSFSIDLTFYEYITSTLSTEWLSVFEQVSFLASKPAIIVISLMTLFFLWLFKKDYAGMITMVVFVMGGNVLNKLIKSWTQRERPAVNGLEEGYSFPSGHVMVGFIMYGIIVYLIYRHSSHTLLKVISLITVTLFLVIIGISRIATEEHYATDVLAGYGFGGVLLVIAIKAHHYIEKERSAKHQVHTGF